MKSRILMHTAHLLSVGVCANTLIDKRAQPWFTFEDIYEAAEEGRLMDLLMSIDDSGNLAAWAADPRQRSAAESALREAAITLEGHELTKAGVGDNPLCLVIALVFEVIRRQHGQRTSVFELLAA